MFMYDDECECDCPGMSEIHQAVASTVDQKIQYENLSKKTLALYKQLKLQKQLQKDDALDANVRKDLLYTNKELVKDIGRSILSNNINFPETYMKLTSDQNTNTILDALQNRSVHLQRNPYGTR